MTSRPAPIGLRCACPIAKSLWKRCRSRTKNREPISVSGSRFAQGALGSWFSGSRLFLKPIGHKRCEIGHTHRVTPLIVVPRYDLEEVIADRHGQWEIDHAGERRANEIGRHQLFVADAQNTLEILALGRLAE